MFDTWARFLSLFRSKLRLCSANHRTGYFSNLACDWLSIVWAYSKQETEIGPRFRHNTPESSKCYSPPTPAGEVTRKEMRNIGEFPCRYHVFLLANSTTLNSLLNLIVLLSELNDYCVCIWTNVTNMMDNTTKMENGNNFLMMMPSKMAMLVPPFVVVAGLLVGKWWRMYAILPNCLEIGQAALPQAVQLSRMLHIRAVATTWR